MPGNWVLEANRAYVAHGAYGLYCVFGNAVADAKAEADADVEFSFLFIFLPSLHLLPRLCVCVCVKKAVVSVMNKHKSVLASYRGKHQEFNCI